MITCRKCGSDKPEEEFHRDRNRESGRRTICKQCRSEAPKGQVVAAASLRPLSAEEELRRKANLLALRELARRHEGEFTRLVGRFRDELGVTKRWQQAG